jgi:hypothetical protein
MDKKKKIEEQYGKVVFEFQLLHAGWELDDKGWIVERGKKRFIVLTNHGVTYVAKKNELKAKIKEYSKAIKQTEKALKLHDKE